MDNMMRPVRVPLASRNIRVVLIVVALVGTGCTGHQAPPPTHPPSPSPIHLAVGKISALLCSECIDSAKRVGVDLAQEVRSTVMKVEPLLPPFDASIFFYVDPAQAIPEVGVGGYASPGTASIYLDPKFSQFKTTLTTWVPQEIAHELHHEARILAGPGYGRTLTQAMITEGMADAFSLQVFPKTPRIPWDHALTPRQERGLWLPASRAGVGYDHADWFFGAGQIPRWAGYTIGYDIVTRYLRRHPETSPSSIATTGAEEILSGSGFPS